MSVRLFVYGSLKRGGRHHEELRGARYLGPAATSKGYRLEALGEYLGLVEVAALEDIDAELSPNAPVVQGELFEVSEELLTVLDEFEGDTYLRGHVRLAPGRTETETETETENGGFDGIALAYFKKAR